MINILTLFIVIAQFFLSRKSFANNKLIKTAKMLRARGDVEKAILYMKTSFQRARAQTNNKKFEKSFI